MAVKTKIRMVCWLYHRMFYFREAFLITLSGCKMEIVVINKMDLFLIMVYWVFKGWAKGHWECLINFMMGRRRLWFSYYLFNKVGAYCRWMIKMEGEGIYYFLLKSFSSSIAIEFLLRYNNDDDIFLWY